MSLDHLRSSLQGGAPLGAPLILTRLATLPPPCSLRQEHHWASITSGSRPLVAPENQFCDDSVATFSSDPQNTALPGLPGMLGPSLRRVPS